MDNAIVDNHVLKASFGTTKYCTNFLKNSVCLNQECLYLHEIADEKDIISRNEMNNNRTIFATQQMMAIELSKILTSKKKQKQLEFIKNKKTIFPNAYDVYNKEVVKNYMKMHKIELPNSKPKQTKKQKKKLVNVNKLFNIFKSKQQSRFDFVKKDLASNANVKIEVPVPLTSYITENFTRSIYFQKEHDTISEYYFSNNQAYDSNDIWAFLINTIKLFNDLETDKDCKENENFVTLENFNST